MPKLARLNKCTGCFACKDICKHGAIQVLNDGMPIPYVDKDLCVNCKMCEKVCPVVSQYKRNDISGENVYGGWIENEALRKLAASGGAFAGVALLFFDLYPNSKVYGASLIDNKVKHIGIECKGDIPLLMNSKYVQSDTIGIYNNVLQSLKDGKYVLFSGLPCQVAALNNFIGKRECLREKLFTIDLICHGVASQEALDLHLKYYRAERIVSFRNKEKSEGFGTSQCTKLIINNRESVIDRKNDIFYNIFSSWLLDRPSCSQCKFAHIERVADITIGDFWGHKDAHGKGVSLIMANNKNGMLLIEKNTFMHIWKVTLKDAFNTNSNLWTGWKAIKWHPMVLWPNWFKNHLTEDKRLNILARRDYVWNAVWALFKIVTILHIRFDKFIVKNCYKDYLK